MKKTLFLTCGIATIILAGCESKSQQRQVALNNDKAMSVVIEDGGVFPGFLVGHWRSDQYNWEFIFEEDGSISSIVHSFGSFPIKPGITTKTTLADGSPSILDPGPWALAYKPIEKELIIEIVIKDIHVKMGDGSIEGHTTDVFVGTVFHGEDYWAADWFSYPKYIINTDKIKGFIVTEDPNEPLMGHLIFHRVKEE